MSQRGIRRQEAAKQNGVCIQCHKHPPRPHRTTCAACAQKMSDYGRERRRIRKASGLCIYCGEKSITSGSGCKQCRVTKDSYNKTRRSKLRLSNLCWQCRRPAHNKSLCDACRARIRLKDLEEKVRAMRVYGNGSCSCCGECHLSFLSLDHVNGGGNRHRKQLGGSANIYKRLRQLGYPKDPPLAVLCFNCNLGRQLNGGICPHVTDPL